jgi:hypothetical protein
LNAHPCAYNELARILRATLTGLFVMPSPRQTGPEDQNQEQQQEHVALALRVPIALRRQRTKRPVGCARGTARIPLLHRMCN